MFWTIVDYLAPFVPFSIAMRGIDSLLRAQGFGSGARRSGATDVFNLIQTDNPLLVDVGGHIGDYSASFLTRFPMGRVVLFEPSDAHLKLARKNLSRFASVQFCPIALSEREGAGLLYKNAEITGLASLTKRRLDHFDIHMDRTEPITCRTLDSVVSECEINEIDLLKIDVEGHELEVLNGAVETIEAGRVKIIQFEFGGCNLDTRTTFQDFFYFFNCRGFNLHVVQPSGRLVHLPSYMELYEQYCTTNYVAIKPS